jgi:hypothetical protein
VCSPTACENKELKVRWDSDRLETHSKDRCRNGTQGWQWNCRRCVRTAQGPDGLNEKSRPKYGKNGELQAAKPCHNRGDKSKNQAKCQAKRARRRSPADYKPLDDSLMQHGATPEVHSRTQRGKPLGEQKDVRFHEGTPVTSQIFENQDQGKQVVVGGSIRSGSRGSSSSSSGSEQ